MRLLDELLGRREWWRAFRGGHWERWWNEADPKGRWCRVTRCSKVTGERLGRFYDGPDCEDR